MTTTTTSTGPRAATSNLIVEEVDTVTTVTFDRPGKLNALTPEMYTGLEQALSQLREDPVTRLLVIRGAGGAFAAGSDIAHFRSFTTGEDGVAYEERFVSVLEALETVHVPTLAVIDGACAGAGLLLAAACDVRIATTASSFGLPIARTLGNALSAYPLALLADRLGSARLMSMVARARMMPAAEAAEIGFVTEVAARGDFGAVESRIVRELLAAAPLTMSATREVLRRIRNSRLPASADVVRSVYDSDDFRTGVSAFLRKERAQWSGR
jgi:enoyl-CoA hydratase/carnithine racemase